MFCSVICYPVLALTRPILVIHFEGPSKFLLWGAGCRHVGGHHELLEEERLENQVDSEGFMDAKVSCYQSQLGLKVMNPC